jgi:hypothetical protein
MEGGALFNSGYLGSSFIWWIGQIADDSTWRDNRLTGKFPNKESIPGWGARYKVRIMGVHDQGQIIPEEDLPWANIIYPVTAGGGQTNSWMSSNLRQGNIVFGFYMDGQNMQNPVILGVLGNNAQTNLGMVIGENDDGVTNTQPGSIAKSGFAKGSVPKKGSTQELVPDEALTVEKPTKQEITKESAESPPGTQTNQYGLPKNRVITQSQQNDIASAKADAEEQGLSGEEAKEFVKSKVKQGIENRAGDAKAPFRDPEPGPTIENPDAMHQLSAGDVKRNDKYNEKVVLMNPDDAVGSATKAMQTEIDNLTSKIDKFMGSRKQYIDAVSGPPNQNDIEKEIKLTARKISKYQKVIMDKIGEFQSKKLNEELTKTVAAMPSSMRYMFADQKFLNTEENIKKYNEITNKMVDQMEGILKGKLQIPQLTAAADALAASGALWADSNSSSAIDALMSSGGDDSFTDLTTGSQAFKIGVTDDSVTGPKGVIDPSNPSPIKVPKVPVCYAEDVVAQGIAVNQEALQDVASSQHNNYNKFLENLRSQLTEEERKLKDKAYDKTGLGKVTVITDEEEDDLPQGGTNYYSENGVPCAGGSGTGFKVDIVVPDGGLYDNGFLTINDGGAGYTVNTADGGGVSGTGSTTAATTTGGSGTGIKVNYTISSGAITGISTNTAGANYKNGDILTVVNNASGTPSTNATFTIDNVRGTVNTVANGGITIADPGNGYKIGELLTVQQSGSGNNCGVVITQVLDPGEKKATAGPVTPGDTNGSVADSKPSIGQKLGDMLQMLGGMEGSMTQALDFKNLEGNIFPFENPPNKAITDFYTLATGGAGQDETQKPSMQSIDKTVAGMDLSRIKDKLPEIPFAGPGKGTPPIDLISKAAGGFGSGLTQDQVNQAMKKVKALQNAGEDIKGKLSSELKNMSQKNNPYKT